MAIGGRVFTAYAFDAACPIEINGGEQYFALTRLYSSSTRGKTNAYLQELLQETPQNGIQRLVISVDAVDRLAEDMIFKSPAVPLVNSERHADVFQSICAQWAEGKPLVLPESLSIRKIAAEVPNQFDLFQSPESVKRSSARPN